MPISTRVKGLRISGPTKGVCAEDEVALEAPINLYVNDKHFVTIFATPHDLRELALGHLLGEGIIDSINEVSRIDLDGTNVLVSTIKDVEQRMSQHRQNKMIYGGCGSVEDYMEALDRLQKPLVSSTYTVSSERLMDMIRSISKETGSYRMSISVHTAAIFTDGSLTAFMEDVSRYATVDKAIGRAALVGADFSKSILFTTGRQAADMVLKAARVGIPITVSLRGPLHSGVYAAHKTGVTMVSNVRGKGLTVYTHPSRIYLSPRTESSISIALEDCEQRKSG